MHRSAQLAQAQAVRRFRSLASATPLTHLPHRLPSKLLRRIPSSNRVSVSRGNSFALGRQSRLAAGNRLLERLRAACSSARTSLKPNSVLEGGCPGVRCPVLPVRNKPPVRVLGNAVSLISLAATLPKLRWLRVWCAYTVQPPSAVRPNPSLKLTRYGRLCKPGLWHMVHHHRPGLHSLPPRAA
jgi:hypothetical protein